MEYAFEKLVSQKKIRKFVILKFCIPWPLCRYLIPIPRQDYKSDMMIDPPNSGEACRIYEVVEIGYFPKLGNKNG